MKFYVTPYHSNLIKDKDRIAVFFEGILEFSKDNIDGSNNSFDFNSNSDINPKDKKLELAFDIGCGSGVLSLLASNYFNHIIAIDIDSKIIEYAKKSFKEAKIDNVSFINDDVSLFDFEDFADLIICEMLDTALIDEEEIPALKNAKKYLKKDGKIIPKGIINMAEPIYMERDYIHYEDEEYHGKKPKYAVLGSSVKIGEFDFLEDFPEEFKTTIDFTFNKDNVESSDYKNKSNNLFNGIKITTFTKINDNIICGPTPMLNPPLFIPINAPNGIYNKISVELEYIMGRGIETIKTSIIDN